jgi:DNA ligase-1
MFDLTCPAGLPSRRATLGALAVGLCGWALPVGAVRRAGDASGATPAPLAHGLPAPAGLDPAPYLCSEKFDGVRAWWDGRALRFRSGAPISAPGWFTQRLPAVSLDGELWLGRGTFEALSGAVRRREPEDAAWRQIRYMLFDLPGGQEPFSERAGRLAVIARQAAWPALQAAPQERLTDPSTLRRRLEAVVRGGGEGLMLHRASARWQAGRSDAILKVKPSHDEEATVLAVMPGRGRLEGHMGALRVRTDAGIEFELGSGFNEALRRQPPLPGERVTFRYQGLTEAGVPRFASFLRR